MLALWSARDDKGESKITFQRGPLPGLDFQLNSLWIL